MSKLCDDDDDEYGLKPMDLSDDYVSIDDTSSGYVVSKNDDSFDFYFL